MYAGRLVSPVCFKVELMFLFLAVLATRTNSLGRADSKGNIKDEAEATGEVNKAWH